MKKAIYRAGRTHLLVSVCSYWCRLPTLDSNRFDISVLSATETIMASLFLATVWLAAKVHATVTLTSTSTVWAPQLTVTIHLNPSDSIVWRTQPAQTVYLSTTIASVPSACLTHEYVYPPEDPTATPSSVEPVVTITRTTTLSSQATTLTLNDRTTPVTRPSLVFPTVTLAERTITQTKCTDTLIHSYFIAATHTSTYTKAGQYTWTSPTEVCKTSVTRWPPVPRVTLAAKRWTLVPRDPASPQFDKRTLVTTREPLTRTVVKTFTTDIVTITSIVCDNPSVNVVSTYYTMTLTASTSTEFRQRSDCSSSALPTAPPPEPTSHLVSGARTQAEATRALDASVPVARRGSRGRRARNAAGKVRRQDETQPTRTPVESHTITRITTANVNGTMATLTLTGVVETYIQTFTTIQMVGHTVTATATSYVSVCSIPAQVTKPAVATS